MIQKLTILYRSYPDSIPKTLGVLMPNNRQKFRYAHCKYCKT